MNYSKEKPIKVVIKLVWLLLQLHQLIVRHPLPLRRQLSSLRLHHPLSHRNLLQAQGHQLQYHQLPVQQEQQVCTSIVLSRGIHKYEKNVLFLILYWTKSLYYINANEIPGERSRENLISSHVKISPLLWLHNKSRLSHQKTIKVKWFGISLVFI